LNDALSSSFPSRPLEALKSCFDVCGADDPGTTASDSRLQPSVGSVPSLPFPKLEHCKSANCNGESLERSVSVPMNLGNSGYHKHSSGSLIPEQVLSPYMNADLERDEFRQKNPSIRNRSGPLLFRQMKDSRTHLSVAPEEPSEGKIIRRRGRFQVTSDSISQKAATSACSSSSSRSNLPIGATRSNLKSSAILPTLQLLMQQNTMQKVLNHYVYQLTLKRKNFRHFQNSLFWQEVLSRLISSIEETSDDSEASTSVSYQSSGGPVREKELQSYVVQLQRSITELTDEVQRLKLRNNQLEQQISALSKNDERSQTEDDQQ
jgi:serine/threonine-protein kinase OSR1/STK39